MGKGEMSVIVSTVLLGSCLLAWVFFSNMPMPQAASTEPVDTKIIAGVPVFNYNHRHYTANSKSARRLRGVGIVTDWVLVLNRTNVDNEWTERVCHAKGICLAAGHPSQKGTAFAVVRATEEELADVLAKYGDGIAYVEPDGPMFAVPEEVEVNSTEMLNDALPWGLDRIDDRAGLDKSYNIGSKGGSGVHVYVADTGIRTTHSDFIGSEGTSRAIPTLDLTLGEGIVECDASDVNCARDGHGHGTHCSGTVGGTKYGVAKGVTLHAVKVLSDQGSGSYSWFVQALDWVVTKGQKPAVFSASLGGPGQQQFVADAIKSATEAGVVVVVAAGNSKRDACQYSPAFAPAAVTVGATTSSDDRASYSNHGSCLDIFAPGSHILSAHSKSDSASATFSGTSMACPHVAGAAALMFQKHPTASATEIIWQLTRTSTFGAVKDPKWGSPNLLVYVGSDDQTIPTTTTVTTTTTLFKCPCKGCWFPTESKCMPPKVHKKVCKAFAPLPIGAVWCNAIETDFMFSGSQAFCPSGWSHVTDLATCKRASLVLHAKDGTSYRGGHLGKDSYLGCFHNMGNDHVHFNSDNLINPVKPAKSQEYVCQRGAPATTTTTTTTAGPITTTTTTAGPITTKTTFTVASTTMTTTVSTSVRPFKVQIREVDGQGCLKSQGHHKLLEKGAQSGCAIFSVEGKRFRSLDVSGQCLDYFHNRGWGLWSCHGGSNQKLHQESSKWCVGSHCIEEAAVATTTMVPSTSMLTSSSTSATKTTTTTTSTVTTASTTTTVTTTLATSRSTSSTLPSTTTSSTSSSAATSTSATVMTTTSEPNVVIESGDTIFLKTRAGHGNHVDIQGDAVQARWESKGSWQAIVIERQGGGSVNSGDTVFLRTHTGAYIDVTGEAVQARWNDKGSWQGMLIQKSAGSGNSAILPGDSVCFKAHTGKHLDVQDTVVQARFDECADWQAMVIEKEFVGAVFSGASIHLLSHTGKRLEVEGNAVGARWEDNGHWQTFSIKNYGGRAIYSGDAVFLEAHTGAMVDVQGEAVQARWNAFGTWQKLIIERNSGSGPVMPGDIVFLRAHTGKMIDVQGSAVQARYSEHGDWQKLIIESSSALRRLAD